MLFPYTYVPHQMEKMQEFIDYIFNDVWCEAPWRKYSLSLFDSCPDLKAVITDLHHTEPEGADFFIKGIQRIFDEFKSLNSIDILRLKRWYKANNDIEGLCDGNAADFCIRYQKLGTIFGNRYKRLKVLLWLFFKDLYSSRFLSLEAVSTRIGTIKNHYNSFFKANRRGKCPFCGISSLLGIHHTKREAYDHYMPKGKYPFNSINFHNLAPSCHTCNSSYKHTKDPIYSASTKRKAFYPFSTKSYSIDVRIDLSHSDYNNLSPADITLQIGPPALQEEISTWKEVFGIDERYKAMCCEESDGKYWLEQVLGEWRAGGRTPDEFMKTQIRNTSISPFAESNFLKTAFLEGCERKGIFTLQNPG